MPSASELERLLEENEELLEELRELRRKLNKQESEIRMLRYQAGKPWGRSTG